MKQLGALIYLVFAIFTAKIGLAIHDSIFWAVMDFFFSPFAWLKWILCEQVNMTVIRQAFAFFYN